MKTTEKMIYEKPLMEAIAIQNKGILMSSVNSTVGDYTDGGEIGDDD